MILLQPYNSLQIQLKVMHGIYETIDELSYKKSSELQNVMKQYQQEIMSALIKTNDFNVITVLSDAVQYSSSFPMDMLGSLLQIILSSLQNKVNIDDSLNLFSNLFIRSLYIK